MQSPQCQHGSAETARALSNSTCIQKLQWCFSHPFCCPMKNHCLGLIFFFPFLFCFVLFRVLICLGYFGCCFVLRFGWFLWGLGVLFLFVLFVVCFVWFWSQTQGLLHWPQWHEMLLHANWSGIREGGRGCLQWTSWSQLEGISSMHWSVCCLANFYKDSWPDIPLVFLWQGFWESQWLLSYIQYLSVGEVGWGQILHSLGTLSKSLGFQEVCPTANRLESGMRIKLCILKVICELYASPWNICHHCSRDKGASAPRVNHCPDHSPAQSWWPSACLACLQTPGWQLQPQAQWI